MILELTKFKERLKETMPKVAKGNEKVVAIYYNPKDEAGVSYVKSKKKMLEEYGFIVKDMPLIDVTTKTLIDVRNEIEENETPFLIQLPLDKKRQDRKSDLELLNEVFKPVAHLDVDGLLDGSDLIPCTPKGIIQIINHYLNTRDYKTMTEMTRVKVNTYEFARLNILIVGRGELIGKPLANELISRGATVTVANSKSPSSVFKYSNYDVVVLALNKRAFLKASDIVDLKYPILFIDCGVFVNPNNNKLEGCIRKYDGDSPYDGTNTNITITSVPGGVGPMTVLNVATNANILRKNTRRRNNMENKKEEVTIEDIKIEETPVNTEDVKSDIRPDIQPNDEKMEDEHVITLEMVATGVLERLTNVYNSIEKHVSILGEKHRGVIEEFFNKMMEASLTSFQFEAGVRRWDIMLLFDVDRNIVNANSAYRLTPVLHISSYATFGQEVKKELVDLGDANTFKGYTSIPLRSQVFDGCLIKECVDIKGNEVKLEEKK